MLLGDLKKTTFATSVSVLLGDEEIYACAMRLYKPVSLNRLPSYYDCLTVVKMSVTYSFGTPVTVIRCERRYDLAWRMNENDWREMSVSWDFEDLLLHLSTNVNTPIVYGTVSRLGHQGEITRVYNHIGSFSFASNDVAGCTQDDFFTCIVKNFRKFLDENGIADKYTDKLRFRNG